MGSCEVGEVMFFLDKDDIISKTFYVVLFFCLLCIMISFFILFGAVAVSLLSDENFIVCVILSFLFIALEVGCLYICIICCIGIHEGIKDIIQILKNKSLPHDEAGEK